MYSAYEMPSVLLAPALVPKPQLCDRDFTLTVDDFTFIGFPMSMARARQQAKVLPVPAAMVAARVEGVDSAGSVGSVGSSNSTAAGGESEQGGASEDELRILNVCLVVKHATPDMMPGWARVARHLAQVLVHEQLRCGYLSDQIRAMSVIRDAWLYAQLDENTPMSCKPDHMALTSQMLTTCSLARELRDLVHSVRACGIANIRVNSWVTLTAAVQPAPRVRPEDVQPFHTLLLLAPPFDSKPSGTLKRGSDVSSDLASAEGSAGATRRAPSGATAARSSSASGRALRARARSAATERDTPVHGRRRRRIRSTTRSTTPTITPDRRSPANRVTSPSPRPDDSSDCTSNASTDTESDTDSCFSSESNDSYCSSDSSDDGEESVQASGGSKSEYWDSILPPDCSPALRRLLEAADPTKNMQDLSNATSLPLSHVRTLAAHLVYWDYAVLAPVLTGSTRVRAQGDRAASVLAAAGRSHFWSRRRSMNGESSQQDLAAVLVRDFASRFPGVSLLRAISAFADVPAKPLRDQVSLLCATSSSKYRGRNGACVVHNPVFATRSELVAVVAWMLRQRVVVTIRTFAYAIYDDETVKSILLEMQDPELTARVSRLLPLLRRGASMEELMDQEGLTRTSLANICTRCAEFICLLDHEG